MKIAILQPGYLPWLGFFEQMALVDKFVYLDDVQYTKKDWRNRNRIKTANGILFLTVPVFDVTRNTRINDAKIYYGNDWVKNHLKAIYFAYCKAAHFQPLFDELKEVLEKRPNRLIDLNVALVDLLCRHLNINTPVFFSSDAKIKGIDKNDRIIRLCKHYGSTFLYDGKSAQSFIDIERFSSEGIKVVFQDYCHPVYKQLYGQFISHLAAIDLIFNHGPEAGKILISTNQESICN
ncbi:MAG: hypothetical protein JL50_11395 [Peptococcaceae bacterium BICA1-7]|nr:MAG: hypothetical protein JL50_11395 [Peptococcaceae bacterium BICA1-7]